MRAKPYHHTCQAICDSAEPLPAKGQTLAGGWLVGGLRPWLLLGLDFWCLDCDLWNADRRPLDRHFHACLTTC